MKLSTREQRIKATLAIILKLEAIAQTENDYAHSLPACPESGVEYVESLDAFKRLDEALALLHQAYIPAHQPMHIVTE